MLKASDCVGYVCLFKQLSLAASRISSAITRPGEDSWVVDTGSGHHLTSRKRLTQKGLNSARHSVDPLKLKTANGVIECNAICDARVEILDRTVEVRILPDTPNVLSVSKLVEEGAVFHWDLQSGATLTYKGITHQLSVHYGVPRLPASALISECAVSSSTNVKSHRLPPHLQNACALVAVSGSDGDCLRDSVSEICADSDTDTADMEMQAEPSSTDIGPSFSYAQYVRESEGGERAKAWCPAEDRLQDFFDQRGNRKPSTIADTSQKVQHALVDLRKFLHGECGVKDLLQPDCAHDVHVLKWMLRRSSPMATRQVLRASLSVLQDELRKVHFDIAAKRRHQEDQSVPGAIGAQMKQHKTASDDVKE